MAVLLFASCEEESEPLPEQSAFRVTRMESLPASIQAEILKSQTALKTTNAYKNRSTFGSPLTLKVHRLQKAQGGASYTLALSRTTGDNGFYYDNLVVNEDEAGALTTRIIRYHPEPQWYAGRKAGVAGYDTYSGIISIFSYNGGLISAVAVEEGTVTGPVAAKTTDAANGAECEIVDIQEAGLLQNGNFYVYEITIILDCTHQGSQGAGGADNGMSNGYGPGEGGGGGGPGGGAPGGPGAPVDTVPVEEEQIIIDPDFSEDYPCQAAIVQEVYSNCAPLSQLFQDIFESSDAIHVTFIAEDLNNILEGGRTITINGQPLDYIIKLNTERLAQSTELDIITTFTHEYVHAILFYFYQAGSFQLTGAGNPPTYSELAEGFAKHRAGFGGNHHPYIATLLGDIAEVTYAWAISHGYEPDTFAEHDSNLADDVDGLREFLNKLAWGGLTDTPTFENLYPNGTLERHNLQKLILDEIFPEDADANPQGESPVPCN